LKNQGTFLRVVAEGESPCSSDTAVVRLTIQKQPVAKVDEDVTICEGMHILSPMRQRRTMMP
jgi:hypothetical protein